MGKILRQLTASCQHIDERLQVSGFSAARISFFRTRENHGLHLKISRNFRSQVADQKVP
jgi:hypothetical protein